MPRVQQPANLRLAFLADPNSVHTRRWIDYFAEAGHDIHLLIGDEDAVHPGLRARVAVHRYRRFGVTRLPFASSLQGGRALRMLLDRINPQVLHAHYLDGYGWQARLSEFHPYAVSIWGSDLFETPRRSARARWWARRTLASADLVTVASSDMRAQVIGFGARPDRVVQVQFGVDTDRFAPGDADPRLEAQLGVAGKRVIFSPRAIQPFYRHETIARAVARLPEDVVLIMTSRNADRAYLADFTRLANDLGLTDRMVIIEDIADADMPGMYRLSQAVVSIPESDGIAVSVLEAMACGRPVVATDLPGLREFLHGETGVRLVAGADVEAVSEALATILGMAPRNREPNVDGLRHIAVEFGDYRTNMRLMEDHYRRISERPR